MTMTDMVSTNTVYLLMAFSFLVGAAVYATCAFIFNARTRRP